MLSRLNSAGNTYVEVATWPIWQQLTPPAPLAPPQLLRDLYDFPPHLPGGNGQMARTKYGFC